MNQLIQLIGKPRYESAPRGVGGVSFPKQGKFTLEQVRELKQQLESLLRQWDSVPLNKNIDPLVTVVYTNVVAKSNRVKSLLRNTALHNNQAVVGVRIVEGQSEITYCIPRDELQQALLRLEYFIQGLAQAFPDVAEFTLEEFNQLRSKQIKLPTAIATTVALNLFCDVYYVQRIYISQRGAFNPQLESKVMQLVSLYSTNLKLVDLYTKVFGYEAFPRVLDDNTLFLDPEQVQILRRTAPYLIAMSAWDEATYDYQSVEQLNLGRISIPAPRDEPIVGVIDSQFSRDVYFADWIEAINTVPNTTQEQYSTRVLDHGTSVTALVVDGPAFNPNLDDGCGRFRVKFFGISEPSGKMSVFHVLQTIERAVRNNPQIKVWNISLGSIEEIRDDYISPAGAFLDRLQYEHDVVFVVSATNKGNRVGEVRIGSPADSLNSLVVGAVNSQDEPASYSRVGNVLSFFVKPDVSYYGGDVYEPLHTCSSLGYSSVIGTSYAAPWITRKMAYLIHHLGLSREVAKALIIDAAAQWHGITEQADYIGYGVVPVHIRDVVESSDDEIKFFFSENVSDYATILDSIPVPLLDPNVPESELKHNYVAKCTLCYFPECSRNQGVDYTNFEVDVHLGPQESTEESFKIYDIKNNTQGSDSAQNLPEAKVRKSFRKWDNTKFLHEYSSLSSSTHRPKKARNAKGLWGCSLLYKQRLSTMERPSMHLGLVVTLKELHGVNRFDEFVFNCVQLRSEHNPAQSRWRHVRVIDTYAQHQVQQQSQNYFEFDDE